MWGSVSSLQSISTVLLWIAAISGGVSVVTSFVASVASNRASNMLQRDADTKIAQANALAAAAGLEALQLKAKMAWRRVTAEQHQALIDSLKGQEFEVWTTFVGNDPEATIYRNEIDKVLSEAGLKTKYYSGWEMALGMKVAGPESKQKALLVKAFQNAGLQFSVEGPSQFMKDDLVVVVGTKPEPL
jgi:hypothetical protein